MILWRILCLCMTYSVSPWKLCWPRSWGQKRQTYTLNLVSPSQEESAYFRVESAQPSQFVIKWSISLPKELYHTRRLVLCGWQFEAFSSGSKYISLSDLKPMLLSPSIGFIPAFIATHEPTIPANGWPILSAQIFYDSFVVGCFLVWVKMCYKDLHMLYLPYLSIHMPISQTFLIF